MIRHVLRCARAAGLWGLMASTVGAAPPPAELFFKLPAMYEISLSPSGKRLAVSAPGTDGRVGVYVLDLQGSDFSPKRAIQFSDRDVTSFSWVNDERLVFGHTDLRAATGADFRRAPGLYAVRYDGQDLSYLVETHGRPFFSAGDRVRTLPWNHVLLHVPTAAQRQPGASGEEVVLGEMHFGADRTVHSISPKWLDTRTGRIRDVDTGGLPCSALRWWFSARGQPRAALCRDKGRESLHWHRLDASSQAGAWTQLADFPVTRPPFSPLWVGSGDQLYVAHAVGPAGERVVAPFDFVRNAPGAPLVKVPGFDFSGHLVENEAGDGLLGVRVRADAETTIWFDPAHKAMQARVDAALPGRVNLLSCRRCGSKDAVALVKSYSDTEPGEILLWRAADAQGKGAWTRLGRLRPDIQPEQMALTDLHRIKARDGRELPVWVTRSRGTKASQPAVVLVHGGPWVRGRYWNWQPMPQFLASRGYVVIEPEFRGSDGYGSAHLRAGFKQWGQAMQDDVADALLWARQQGLANDAACIVGASYGGYSTLMGLIRHPELYRCGSAGVAVADMFLFLEGDWWVSDDISSLGRQYHLRDSVGDVKADREMLVANSPLEQASRITRPLQLVWGSEDLRVPIAHGERLRAAMRKAGRDPEWIVYEGEAHGLGRIDNQVDRARKLEAFLARHLGPP